MTEQQPLDTVSPSASSLDVEPMQADFHEVGTGSASHDHAHLALLYETGPNCSQARCPITTRHEL
jgi:hypothetical protein